MVFCLIGANRKLSFNNRTVLANMTKHDLEFGICDLDLPLMTLSTRLNG